jgi:hypothetical protein
MNTNNKFEDMLNAYLETAEENKTYLNKRAKKKAGKIKAKCSKNNQFILKMEE